VRKYLAVAILYFKTQTAFRAHIILTMAFSLGHILFAFLLWSNVLGEQETLAGFTLQSMMTYYIIQSFFTQIELSSGVSGEVSGRIRGGTFMKYIVVPIDVQGYFTAMSLGASGFYVIIDVITCAIWVFLFGVQLTITSSGLMIAAALLLFVLGMIFMIQFNYFLGLLAFKFQDIWIFLMIKDGLIAFLAGTMVPLVLMPGWFVSTMRFTPFYYVTYLPAMMLVDKLHEEAVLGLCVIIGWGALMFLINRLAYGKMRVRFDGVGI